MPQNCELTWIVEELSLAGNFLHFLPSIGLGPDLVYCRLWWILASCPCPKFPNFGSIGLEYIYFNKPPCWYRSLAKFGILYPIPLPGKIEGRRRRGWQRMRWLDGITDSMDMGLGGFGSWWWTGRPGVLWSMGSQRVGHDWATELNWSYTSRSLFSMCILLLL